MGTARRGIYMDVPVPLAVRTVLPTSCPRSTLSELFSKSHWSVPVFLKCFGPHLFPAQDPSVTLSLPETAQDIKHKLATAIQGFPLSFLLPKHIPDLHTCKTFGCCLSPTQPPRSRSEPTSYVTLPWPAPLNIRVSPNSYQVMMDI